MQVTMYLLLSARRFYVIFRNSDLFWLLRPDYRPSCVLWVAVTGDVSRVKIKVFRGADREEDGKHYAPWGFWVKQPNSQ